MYKYSLPIYEEDKCVLFALGRNAMYAACQALRIESGDSVLTPAFDCNGSLQPFRVLGVRLQFFRSDPYNFSADIDDIKRKITSQTKLIHIINHFGMPQPWDKLFSLSQDTSIPILEDNAYSLLSKINGRLFGTFGDISIFSLRKNLPLIDGGLLRINNPKYTLKSVKKNIPLFSLSDMPSMLKIISDRLGFYKVSQTLRGVLRIITPEIMPPPPLYSVPRDGYPDWPLRDSIGKEFSCDYLRPMSYFSRKKLSKYSQHDYTDIIEKKRYYYKLLSDKLSNVKGIKILWPVLPDGIVPFCLSFLVSSNKRDFIFEVLQKKYNVMAWPTLSKEILIQLEDFPEVQLLGRKLLQLNLESEKVRSPRFPEYIENLTRDICYLLN